MTKGFVTVATGDTHYYKTAVNLLKSYRYFTQNPHPFAIICDRENEYTKLFDKVIILENPSFSYLDKIQILNNIPYDETIFIETDCLAYADLNKYFDAFKNSDNFSAFGKSLPLDAQNTWFNLEETGKYRSEIKFKQTFHSGVVFLRNTETCKRIYDVCMDVEKNYDEYNIGGNRDGLNAHPDGYIRFMIYPQAVKYNKQPITKMHKKICTLLDDENKRSNALLCHWGNAKTHEPIYKREAAALRALTDKKLSFKLKEILLTIYLPIYRFKQSLIYHLSKMLFNRSKFD